MNINTSETRDKYYVKPWRRYFAKIVDFSLLSIGLGILSGFLLAMLNPALLPTTIVSTIIFTIFLMFACCLVEGMLISLFGTTFGKALFRTGVVDANGERLGLAKSVARSLYCGVAGLGAGIPIISFIAHLMGYSTLESDGVTLWDKHVGAYVVHEDMTRLNWIFGITVFGFLYAASIALNFVGMAE